MQKVRRRALHRLGAAHRHVEADLAVARGELALHAAARGVTEARPEHALELEIRPDCTRCHEKQAAAAAGGKHECKACHAPHKPPATDRKGWWNRCVGCHEKEVAASQRHNQCPECHKPHAYKPPACTSCHATEASKGSHLVKGHAECTKCHDAHAATKPTRTQCLACHDDKAAHEPKAPVCYGCHTFK